MCRLSLAWVTSENSTMLLGSDILRLFFTGPYLVSSPLCSVSGVDCPSVDPSRNSLSPVQLPTLPAELQPPTTLLGRVVNSHSWVPLPLPDTARFHVQESFVWFRAKTDSSALAACPHSATPSGQLNYSKFEYSNIPGKELNVNKFTEPIFFQEKKNRIRSH